MAGELAKYLGMRFGKKIEIVPHTVTPKTRIPMVVNGTVDVEMGSTTYTQKREEQAERKETRIIKYHPIGRCTFMTASFLFII